MDGMLRVLDAVGRELASVTEAEHARLVAANPTAAAAGGRLLELAPEAGVLREAPQQLAAGTRQNIVPLSLALPPQLREGEEAKPEGSGEEIMLQASALGLGGGPGIGWRACAAGPQCQVDPLPAAGLQLGQLEGGAVVVRDAERAG
jgi:hypothetical protein